MRLVFDILVEQWTLDGAETKSLTIYLRGQNYTLRLIGIPTRAEVFFTSVKNKSYLMNKMRCLAKMEDRCCPQIVLTVNHRSSLTWFDLTLLTYVHVGLNLQKSYAEIKARIEHLRSNFFHSTILGPCPAAFDCKKYLFIKVYPFHKSLSLDSECLNYASRIKIRGNIGYNVVCL